MTNGYADPGNPTISGPYDFSVPNASAGTGLTIPRETRTVWSGNYIFVRVGGQKLLVTSAEFQNFINQGVDVEARTPGT